MEPEVSTEPKITSADMPALFSAADDASRSAKRNYHIWTGVDLVLLVVGTLLLSIETNGKLQRDLTIYGAAICFIVSWFSTIIILKARYDNIWYGARAIAETAKTLSWKYITCVDPFGANLTVEAAEEALIAKLMKVLSEGKEMYWQFDSLPSNASEIPDILTRTRTLDLEVRKNLHLNHRINDQRTWYWNKARANQKAAQRWLYGVMVAQLLTILFTLLTLKGPEIIEVLGHVNWIHVFSSSAIALLAWMQLKQSHELAQAYGVAAHELGLISQQIKYVKTEDDLCRFVAETEASISREHTMWMAKRERHN